MDYIDGRDLLDVAIEADKANRLLPVDQVAEWMLHVCEAVVYLHRQTPPIVHRDIKPGNIRLNAAGRAILVDFGIAKIDPKSKTQSMAKAVSVGFSPPEQYAGGGGTDTRSDVYALGATLYCLLTVQSPPDGFDRLMRDAPLVPPSRINHLVSPTLEEVVLKAMSLGIEQRYRDAGEMLAAFRAATERGTPLVTRSVCAHCGHANRSGARFCARCGTPFGAAFTCPACGAAVRSTSRFCPRCGRETGSREVGSK
jgi:serine/threonine-protein kinase